MSLKMILAFLLASTVVAFAQVQLPVTGGSAPNVMLPACPAGQFYNGTPPTGCAALPQGGGGGGSGGVSGNAKVHTVNAPVTLVGNTGPTSLGNDGQTFVFNSPADVNQPLPVSGSPGFLNGYSVIFSARGNSCVSFSPTAPSVLYGGPVKICKGQSAFIQADDVGNWFEFVGVSPVIPNPNLFQ